MGMEDFVEKQKRKFEKAQAEKKQGIVGILRQIVDYCDKSVVDAAKPEVDSYSYAIQAIISLRKFAEDNLQIFIKDGQDLDLLSSLLNAYEQELQVREKINTNEDYGKNPNVDRNVGERPESLANVRQIKKEMDN